MKVWAADRQRQTAWSADGITEPRCRWCSWAWRYETKRMEVKFINRLCPYHGRLL